MNEQNKNEQNKNEETKKFHCTKCRGKAFSSLKDHKHD